MKLEEQLEEFSKKIIAEICLLLDSKGVKSKHSSNIVLQIADEEKMFNLEGGRFLIELTECELIDNSGYTYSLDAITIEQLCKVVDSISQQHSKFRVGIEVNGEFEYKYFDSEILAYEYFIDKRGGGIKETAQEVVLDERLKEKNRHKEPIFNTIQEYSPLDDEF